VTLSIMPYLARAWSLAGILYEIEDLLAALPVFSAVGDLGTRASRLHPVCHPESSQG
jgi:hypothetical protein